MKISNSNSYGGNKNFEGVREYDNGTQTKEKIWTGSKKDRFYVNLRCKHTFDQVILRNRKFNVKDEEDGSTSQLRFVEFNHK